MRLTLGWLLPALLFGSCASNPFEAQSPDQDLRIGARAEREILMDDDDWLSIVASLEADVPVKVAITWNGKLIRTELRDETGKPVSNLNRTWFTKDRPRPAPIFLPERGGRYEIRTRLVSPGFETDHRNEVIQIALLPATDAENQLVRKTREAGRRRRERIAAELRTERAAKAARDRLEAQRRQAREAEMRKCSCRGTGLDVMSYRQHRGVGARLVPVEILQVRGSYSLARNAGGAFSQRVKTFRPYACPNCKGANKITNPPRWEPAR